MFGIGNLIEKAFDKMGAPEWLGDVGGLIGDFATGNYLGMIEGGLDLAENAGIDFSQVIPEPLYRAGMAYLSGGGLEGSFGLESFLSSKGFSWEGLLSDPTLNGWAEKEGFGGLFEIGRYLLASQRGVKA